MSAHRKILELMEKLTAEKDSRKFPELVEELHRVLAGESARLEAEIAQTPN